MFLDSSKILFTNFNILKIFIYSLIINLFENCIIGKESHTQGFSYQASDVIN